MDKKKYLLEKITQYLSNVLDEAEQKDTIDYFKLEINNHNGTLQMDVQYKNREKAY